MADGNDEREGATRRFDELVAAYDGPPPVPMEELEREFPPELGFRCSHGWHYAGGKVFPFALVEHDNGTVFQFFPRTPDRG